MSCYYIKARGQTSEFLKAFLVDNRFDWKWHGVIHEVISCSEPVERKNFSAGFLIYDERSGHRAQNLEKYLDDAKVLEKALVQEPNNARYVFYLAQSYVHAKAFPQALAMYERRVTLGGDTEEFFWSLYCIACLKKDLAHPSSEIIQAFCRAYQYKPSQAEPLYRLAQHLSHYPFLGYLLTKYAKEIPLPENAARVQGWIYTELPLEFVQFKQSWDQKLFPQSGGSANEK